MNDGGPAHGKEWCKILWPNFWERLIPEERDILDDLWDAATTATRKRNKLLEVATAAMPLAHTRLGTLQPTPSELATESFKLGAAMLAESERRMDGKA